MRRALFLTFLFALSFCFLIDHGYSTELGKAVGYFTDGPVQGLTYKTPTQSGTTDSMGRFEFLTGETVTFSIGDFVLGSAPGSLQMTPAQLVPLPKGEGPRERSGPLNDPRRVTNQAITNMARFVQSLDNDGNVENGIVIDESARSAVGQYSNKIKFDQDAGSFTKDRRVRALFKELKLALRTPAQARNHLRRSLYGIHKSTDVKVPMRDGSYLPADIFRPIDIGAPDEYPIIMSTGAYGKIFGGHGCICNEEDALKAEETEDAYFTHLDTSRDDVLGGGMNKVTPYSQEHFETINTIDYVPNGYVVVRTDERGICNTPGTFEQFSLQEAEDYYDAIEWLAKQPWSNGRVATNGGSYYGMNSFNVAQLQPPSLKAMIAVDGDIDSYRDYIYTGGGLYNLFNFNACITCVDGKQYSMREGSGKCNTVDWIKIAKENPFYDPAIYGPKGSLTISPDPSNIVVPFFTHVNVQSGIHLRGTSELFIHAASQNKKFALLDEIGGFHGLGEFTKQYMDFLDYWLKGIDNGVMAEPPVQIQVLTGYPGYYWLHENEWPIARTRYTKFYLDASPSSWNDGQKSQFLKMSTKAAASDSSTTYAGDVKPDIPCYESGVSFVTDPMPEDTVIAGYGKVVLYVSSTTEDMAVHAAVRAVDENNQEVLYRLARSPSTLGHYSPFQRGELKVSHRKLDPDRSTIYRPYHTHLEADYQPLTPGKVVEAQIELWPGTALIKKGWRIRLDVQPVPGCGGGTLVDLDQSYQAGSSNTIYTGPQNMSYLQLAVVPDRE